MMWEKKKTKSGTVYTIGIEDFEMAASELTKSEMVSLSDLQRSGKLSDDVLALSIVIAGIEKAFKPSDVNGRIGL